MNRSLKVDRLYNLGDFKHLQLIDEITDIPDALNQEKIEKISYLQLLTVEITFKKYAELAKKANTFKEEEVLKFLEEERSRTIEEIKTLIKVKE
jgi:hypothetical protein